jgi:hypothetical protein
MEDAVYKAIHIYHPDIQTTATAQRENTDLEVVYLNEREARDCEETINRAFAQTWLTWVAQVRGRGCIQRK